MIASARVGETNSVRERPVDSSDPRTGACGQASATAPPQRSAMRCPAKNTPSPIESTKVTAMRSKRIEWVSPSSNRRRISARSAGADELSSSPRRRNISTAASTERRSQDKVSVTSSSTVIPGAGRGSSVSFAPGRRGSPCSGGEGGRGRLGLVATGAQDGGQRGEEGVDDGRVELRSAALADDADRGVDVGRVLVDALAGDRVEDVGHGDDATDQRDAVAGD